MRVMITGREFARLMGWSISTVWKRRAKGTLPVTPLPFRPREQLRFPLADVEAYIGHPIDIEQLDFEAAAPRLKKHKPVEGPDGPGDV